MKISINKTKSPNKSTQTVPNQTNITLEEFISRIQSYIERIQFKDESRTLIIAPEKKIKTVEISEKTQKQPDIKEYILQPLINESQYNDYKKDVVEILDRLSSFMTEIELNIQSFVNSTTNKVTNEDISKKLWDLCTHIYDSVIKPISQIYYIERQSDKLVPINGPNQTTTNTKIKYVFVKNDDSTKIHKFFKEFLMGPVLRLNYHYSTGNRSMDLNETLITKKFNGFTTCVCIFENLAKLQGKITEYILIDEQLHNFVNTNIQYFGNVSNAYKMVIQLKLEQFLTLIDLCRINTKTGIEKLIKIINEIPSGEPGTKSEIPKDLINLLVRKLRNVNDVNQMDFADRDETFTEMFGQYEKEGKKEKEEGNKGKEKEKEKKETESSDSRIQEYINDTLTQRKKIEEYQNDIAKLIDRIPTSKIMFENLTKLNNNKPILTSFTPNISENGQNAVRQKSNTDSVDDFNNHVVNYLKELKNFIESLKTNTINAEISVNKYIAVLGNVHQSLKDINSVINTITKATQLHDYDERYADFMVKKDNKGHTVSDNIDYLEKVNIELQSGTKTGGTDYHKYIKYKTRYLSLKHQ